MMLGRRVLRARTLPGITQEIYAALLTVYQALRIAITDATITTPGTDPDRASFTIALQAARDRVLQAAGVIAAPRAVKRPLSRYAYKSLRVDRRTYQATISIKHPDNPTQPLTTRP